MLNQHYWQESCDVVLAKLCATLYCTCVGAYVSDNFVLFNFWACLCVLGGALGRYVQRKLSGLKIFEEQFVSVRESLRMGVAICEQWVEACDHLTGQVWNILKWKECTQIQINSKENSSLSLVCKGFILILRKCLKHMNFSQVWKRHAPHPWKGNKHCPQTLHCLAKRLDEVGCG